MYSGCSNQGSEFGAQARDLNLADDLEGSDCRTGVECANWANIPSRVAASRWNCTERQAPKAKRGLKVDACQPGCQKCLGR